MLEYIDGVRQLAIDISSPNKTSCVWIYDDNNKTNLEPLLSCYLETKPYKPFTDEELYKTDVDKFLLELYACAVNYCFWYGRSDIRPFGSSSTKLYNTIDKAFRARDNNQVILSKAIKRLIRLNRYPLIEERCNHIDEISYWVNSRIRGHESSYGPNGDPEYIFESLLKNTSCYGNDLFLKRLQLLFIQLHRRFGWYEDFVKTLTVPADYQLPKVLNAFGAIDYSDELKTKINNAEIIIRGSREETEIRAATIVVCDMIVKELNIFPYQVDDFLFSLAKSKGMKTKKFHLTITTDY